MRARHYLNIAAALVATLAASCHRVTRRTPDDTIVVLIEASVNDLDPRFASSNNEDKLSRIIAPGLTTIDNASLTPQMELAERVTNIDPLTWEVVLRPAAFPDGSPLTVDDVLFTYETTMDPAVKSPYRKGWAERIASMEKLDERTLRFHLKQPLATFLSDLEYGVVSARAARANGGRFRNGGVVGAGAYQLVSLSSSKVLLRRNPHYHGAPPPSEKILVRTIPDASARLLMLVGGSADLAQNAVRPDLLGDVARKPRLVTVSGHSALLSYVLLQNEDPILRDVRVRRAIAHAIDRDKIIRAKFSGRAVPATGLLPPDHWAYTGDVDRYDYDPELARRLLDEAGYPDPDGPGPRPRFTLTYKTSADQFRVAIARVIAQELGDVGIAVEVRSFEFSTFFADIKAGNFQMATMQTGVIAEPDMLYTYFHSSRIPSKADPNLQNRWRYRNADVDRLTAAGRQEMDPAKRKEIYIEVQKILARDLPIIPLWHEDNVAVLNKDLHGFQVLANAHLSGLTRASKGKD